MEQLLINKFEPKYLYEFNYSKKYTEYIEKIVKNTDLNILLLGNSGSGKTLLIDAILYSYYEVTTFKNIIAKFLYKIWKCEQSGKCSDCIILSKV